MRSAVSILAFIGIYFGVIIGAHAYIGARLLLAPQWPTPYPTVGLWALGVLCTLMLANPFLHRMGPERLARLVALPAHLWMATVFYLLTLTAVSDVTGLLTGALGPAQQQLIAKLVGGGAVVIVLGGMISVALGPKVKRVEVALPRWPAALDGYRIVQISDVHIGLLLRRSFAQRLTETINQLGADLVAITGDLVDGSVGRLAAEVAPFGALSARDGVYFVTGNHDHYANAKAWCAELESLGMSVLRNRHEVVGEGERAFVLAGVDDHSAGRDRGRGTVERALEGSPEEHPRVLLAHNPQSFIEASKQGVDLQLSGHTHGGQMWPFRYLVRLQTKWIAGLYRRGASAIYVSLGTGFWGPPVRIGAPAEITELVLRPG